MTEISFDGIKINWEQLAYLQQILSPQQLITFMLVKAESPKNSPQAGVKSQSNGGLFGGGANSSQTGTNQQTNGGLFGRPNFGSN